MAHPNLDELDRVRFAWPEPLVIELLCDHYGPLLPDTAFLAMAKLHQRLLRSLIEDSPLEGATLRNQLVSQCRAAGLGVDVIARIESAVFFELMRIVGQRFRNSPRLRNAYGEQLKAALSQDVTVAPVGPRPISTRPVSARPQIGRWRSKQALAT